MKNVKLFNDNVLIRIETFKFSIVLPDSKDGSLSDVVKAKNITILEKGEDVKNVEIGDNVVLLFDPLKSANPYNSFLETPEDPKEKNCNAFYYFIKKFDIVAKVINEDINMGNVPF